MPTNRLLATLILCLIFLQVPAAFGLTCRGVFETQRSLMVFPKPEGHLKSILDQIQAQPQTQLSLAMKVREIIFNEAQDSSLIHQIAGVLLDGNYPMALRESWLDLVLPKLPSEKAYQLSLQILKDKNLSPDVVIRIGHFFGMNLKKKNHFYQRALDGEIQIVQILLEMEKSADPEIAKRAWGIRMSNFGEKPLQHLIEERKRGLRRTIDVIFVLSTEKPSASAPLKTVALDDEYVGEGNFIFGVKRYQTVLKQHEFRIFIVDGRFYNSRGDLLGSGGEVRIDYVMDELGFFYGGHGKVDEIHHSTYLDGAPVAGAGEMVIRDGILVKINRKSGHYGPPQEIFNQVLTRLGEFGVPPFEASDGFAVPKKTNQRWE